MNWLTNFYTKWLTNYVKRLLSELVDQLSKEAVKWSGRPIKYVGCISEVVDQFTKYNIYAM